MTLDVLVTVDAPDGSSATLAVAAKRLLATRDVLEQVAQLRSLMTRADVPDAVPMLVARYLAPSTREGLEREGVGYADATGKLGLMIDRPGLFVRNVGEDRDPWRGPGRPKGTLKGAPAGRVADVAGTAARLGLRPVDKGANVLLAANEDEPSFARAERIDGVMTAAPSQVAVDLLTAPGRSPSEGQALLDWMEANEQRWRR